MDLGSFHIIELIIMAMISYVLGWRSGAKVEALKWKRAAEKETRVYFEGVLYEVKIGKRLT